MVKPENISTDVYAAHAKEQYLGLTVLAGLSSMALGEYAAEHIDRVEGIGLMGLAITVGCVAAHTLHKTLQYAKRERQLEGK
jgi:hypothetical protein